MSELRRDPLSNRWVVIAEGRSQRPEEFPPAVAARAGGRCPFCAGNESDTPEPVAVYGAHNGAPQQGSWHVRVVPNKYPAVETRHSFQPRSAGLYESAEGFGIHEVIIESPEHHISLSQLNDEQLGLTFQAYRDRLSAAKLDQRLVYGQIFKNVGALAGATIEHTHSQFLATPILPLEVAQELAAAERFQQQQGMCIFCHLIAQATARKVAETRNLVALCPYASRVPFEAWILPRQHVSHFEDCDPQLLEETAHLVRQLVAVLEPVLGRPAYNYLIHTAPFDTSSLDHYHWHIEILPRLTRTAGYEWATGFFINPVSPERAAATLRAQWAKSIKNNRSGKYSDWKK